MKYEKELLRQTVDLNCGWKFQKGYCFGAEKLYFDDSSWEDVVIPHDYSLDGPYSRDENALDYRNGDFTPYVVWLKDGSQGYLPRGKAVYRKSFEIGAQYADKKIFVEFDGVFRNSTTYINGYYSGNHYCGYTPFVYDITDYIKFDSKNVLAVRLEPEQAEGWFYEGRGMYRPVRLILTNKLHIDKWGTFVYTEKIDQEKNFACIKVETEIVNEYEDKSIVELESLILDKDGNIVAADCINICAAAGEKTVLKQDITVPSPTLWCPENPYMYRLLSVVKKDGVEVDSCFTGFGIRSYFFDADKGFFLNGKHYKLTGVCNHDDIAGLGSALPERVHFENIRQLREAGVLLLRGAHNKRSPQELDACDANGILVYSETRYFGSGKLELEALGDMIKMDRNHPSIIAWSMGNEEPIQGTDESVRIAKKMMALTKKLDPTRPITQAMNGNFNTPNGFTDMFELNSYNWQGANVMDMDHANYPWRKILVSEHSFGGGNEDEYAKRDYIAGSCMWPGFEYKGELSWPNLSWPGQLWDCAHFEKMKYYKFQALNLFRYGKYMLHVSPTGGWKGEAGREVSFEGFTNCEQVEILIDGSPYEIIKMRDHCGDNEFSDFKYLFTRDVELKTTIKYVPGASLCFVGKVGGKEVCRQDILPVGNPEKIVMKPLTYELSPDGDVCPVAVFIQDKNGTTIEDSDCAVSFEVSGSGFLAGLGSANVDAEKGGTEPDKPKYNCNRKTTCQGRLKAFIGTCGQEGEIVVKAAAPGLEGAQCLIKVRAGTDTRGELPSVHTTVLSADSVKVYQNVEYSRLKIFTCEGVDIFFDAEGENAIYPLVVKAFVSGQLVCEREYALFDGKKRRICVPLRRIGQNGKHTLKTEVYYKGELKQSFETPFEVVSSAVGGDAGTERLSRSGEPVRVMLTDTRLEGFDTAEIEGESCIKFKWGAGNVQFFFDKPDGQNTYNVNVRYFDDDNGKTSFTIYIDSIKVHSFCTEGKDNCWKNRTIENVFVVHGQLVRIDAGRVGEGSMSMGALSYIEFVAPEGRYK